MLASDEPIYQKASVKVTAVLHSSGNLLSVPDQTHKFTHTHASSSDLVLTAKVWTENERKKNENLQESVFIECHTGHFTSYCSSSLRRPVFPCNAPDLAAPWLSLPRWIYGRHFIKQKRQAPKMLILDSLAVAQFPRSHHITENVCSLNCVSVSSSLHRCHFLDAVLQNARTGTYWYHSCLTAD